jgi:hypothetical protein
MRPVIDRIQLDGSLRKLKRCLCFIAVPKEARVDKMLNVIDLNKAAVARRECRIFTDSFEEDVNRPLPAFRIKLRHQTLSAKPTVVDVE